MRNSIQIAKKSSLLIAAVAGISTLSACQVPQGMTKPTPAPTTITKTAAVDERELNTPTPQETPNGSQMDDWSEVSKKVLPSVVAVTVGDQSEESTTGSTRGSGVILNKEGYVVTNEHVVRNAGKAKITVSLSDSRVFPATVSATDPSTDLAVIKLTGAPNDLTPIIFADSSKVEVGDPTMAIGNPLGLSGTVTTGIVSALNRPVTTNDTNPMNGEGAVVVTNAIQTSAAVNPGNSGGALVNADGQLIGINSSIASVGSSRSGSIGIGFAIPSNQVKYIVSQLSNGNEVSHAFLGVDSKSEIVESASGERTGVIVGDVAAGSPAEKAGIRPGDQISSVNDVPISGSMSLRARIRSFKPGDQVTIQGRRDNQDMTFKVTLGATQ